MTWIPHRLQSARRVHNNNSVHLRSLSSLLSRMCYNDVAPQRVSFQDDDDAAPWLDRGRPRRRVLKRHFQRWRRQGRVEENNWPHQCMSYARIGIVATTVLIDGSNTCIHCRSQEFSTDEGMGVEKKSSTYHVNYY